MYVCEYINVCACISMCVCAFAYNPYAFAVAGAYACSYAVFMLPGAPLTSVLWSNLSCIALSRIASGILANYYL